MSGRPLDCEVAILGAGAIGSILGAHLQRAGSSLAFLARGARADRIEADGVRIVGLADFTAPARVVRDPAELRRANVLIVATKAIDTAAALERLRHVEVGLALSIQNGLLKHELLSDVFKGAAAGAVADLSGEMRGDGEVLFTRNDGLWIGELDGRLSPRVSRLAQALNSAGVRSGAVDEIRSLEWSKFAAWVGLAVLSVTTRSPTARFLANPDAAALIVRLVRDVERLAYAEKVELSDQATLPVKTLCRLGPDDAAARIAAIGEIFANRSPGHRVSALQDLEAGRPLEIGETLEWALRRAKQLGVDVPSLAEIVPLVRAIGELGAQQAAHRGRL